MWSRQVAADLHINATWQLLGKTGGSLLVRRQSCTNVPTKSPLEEVSDPELKDGDPHFWLRI